eukprot:1138504-Pelagomonas_calceolata.AAC.5
MHAQHDVSSAPYRDKRRGCFEVQRGGLHKVPLTTPQNHCTTRAHKLECVPLFSRSMQGVVLLPECSFMPYAHVPWRSAVVLAGLKLMQAAICQAGWIGIAACALTARASAQKHPQTCQLLNQKATITKHSAACSPRPP